MPAGSLQVLYVACDKYKLRLLPYSKFMQTERLPQYTQSVPVYDAVKNMTVWPQSEISKFYT